MQLSLAREYAEIIKTALAGVCARIEIAGSARRGQPEGIHDIEIVAVPYPVKAVFGNLPVSDLHHLTDALCEEGVMLHRLDKNWRSAWGMRYRRAVWHFDDQHSAPLDLFICEPGNFGAIFCIRTGPDDFSKLIVTARRFGGAMPTGMRQQDGWLWQGTTRLATPTELDFFAALGLPFIEPAERTAEWLSVLLREAA